MNNATRMGGRSGTYKNTVNLAWILHNNNMFYLIIAIIVISIVFAPQWWAKRTFARYSVKDDNIPGTGAELARHLLDRFDMQHVSVVLTDQGDHYDLNKQTVALTEKNFNDKSLTAIAVATHEVGHAIQHHNSERKLQLRGKLVELTNMTSRLGSWAMMIVPFAVLITKNPTVGFALFLAGFLSIAGSAVVHLVTLPVEWDASFAKALPILKAGYVPEKHHKAVEQILKAAAFTYVASSLASILNVWRWIALLRR